MTPTRERRLEMALEAASRISAGAMEDLDQMKRFHPPGRRGSSYTRHLESLEQRLAGLEAEVREALA